MKKEIEKLEERLRVAMLNSDVVELDDLISDELIFTSHLGQKLSKQDDLEAHRNKIFTFTSIEFSEQEILLLGNVSIVSVGAEIKGRYNGQEANGNFRFTRVWSYKAGGWQVLAAHSSLIV